MLTKKKWYKPVRLRCGDGDDGDWCCFERLLKVFWLLFIDNSQNCCVRSKEGSGWVDGRVDDRWTDDRVGIRKRVWWTRRVEAHNKERMMGSRRMRQEIMPNLSRAESTHTNTVERRRMRRGAIKGVSQKPTTTEKNPCDVQREQQIWKKKDEGGEGRKGADWLERDLTDREKGHEENPRRRSKRLRGKGGSIRKGIEFNSEGSSRFIPISGSPLWFWRCLARSQRIRNRLFGESGEETTGSEDSSFGSGRLGVPGCPVERTKVFFGRHRDGDSSSHGILQNARVAGRTKMIANCCSATSALLNKYYNVQIFFLRYRLEGETRSSLITCGRD